MAMRNDGNNTTYRGVRFSTCYMSKKYLLPFSHSFTFSMMLSSNLKMRSRIIFLKNTYIKHAQCPTCEKMFFAKGAEHLFSAFYFIIQAITFRANVQNPG